MNKRTSGCFECFCTVCGNIHTVHSCTPPLKVSCVSLNQVSTAIKAVPATSSGAQQTRSPAAHTGHRLCSTASARAGETSHINVICVRAVPQHIIETVNKKSGLLARLCEPATLRYIPRPDVSLWLAPTHGLGCRVSDAAQPCPPPHTSTACCGDAARTSAARTPDGCSPPLSVA